MPLIALTGGIASGKSTIAARLAELGAAVVDADALAREVVEPGEPALRAIQDAFGDAVLREDGSLDRAALGRIVFSDPQRRHVLNGIVHPAVLHRSHAAFDAAFKRDRGAVVVYDVPLIDARGVGEFDRIVVADAPADVRIERLVGLRGMTEEDARARVAAQLSDEDRRALATDLVDTSGSLERTLAQTDALWSRLRP
ncbi:dephospho-CoA kinase [Amnibacterium kyonggiense]|uniref:Dephospho-CoA kinase n=1 Tax=Amnibacterium kyonggiense TaxID=595671 RepID=A0A4R7FLY7_9MICO|nr:dephospho-CoA kinase [Amnibacterium kyonggiense]TDS77396.1 dephospho-CoA kinase [Amnibacterium kyonggiense]